MTHFLKKTYLATKFGWFNHNLRQMRKHLNLQGELVNNIRGQVTLLNINNIN